MRRRFGQALRVGVSAGAVAVIATNRWRRDDVAIVAERRCPDAALDTIGATVGALLADSGCDGWPVSFIIADDLARLWQVTPPPDAARLADLEAAAGLRFQTLYGDAPLAWRIAAAWDAARPFTAAALPRQLLALLERGAGARRMKVIEIVPQFVAGANRWRGAVGPQAWYGLVHDGVLTLRVHGAARTVALPAQADAAWLARQLEREALRLDVEAPSRLMVSGQVPPGWANGTNSTALGPERERERAGWSSAVWLAATGSAV